MSESSVTQVASASTDENAKPFAAEQSRALKLPTAVLGLAVAPDGRTLYAACMDGGVYAVDFDSGAVEPIGRHESYASNLVLIGESGPLISSGYDGQIQWHDPVARQTVRNVQAHDFWSWRLAASPDGRRIASTTGRYQCGGYKYEPAAEREPSVKVFDVESGAETLALTHVPPVESVAFSGDGRYLAAGNLMGEVRVWDVNSGELFAQWTTPDFTGWGIIKGHYYTGGVFAMRFTPGDQHLLLAGMGTTRDPAAGNGRQLWQRFDWRAEPPTRLSETREDESGKGLMEALDVHPSHAYFAMGGRLKEGEWNVAFFDLQSGRIGHSLNTKMRVTQVAFTGDGGRMVLAGCVSQPKQKENGRYKPFGRIQVFDLVGAWQVT